MKKFLKTSFMTLLLLSVLSSCHYKGDGMYILINNTEDTVFYTHAFILHENSNFGTQQKIETITHSVVDTILPQSDFDFAYVEKDQMWHLDEMSLAIALSSSKIKVPYDSTAYKLKYQNKTYIIDYFYDVESFFYTKNYENGLAFSTYYFYLKEYIDKLEERERNE